MSSSVLLLGYRLDDKRFPAGASDFSLLQEAHIWSGAYSPPCTIRAGVLSRVQRLVVK